MYINRYTKVRFVYSDIDKKYINIYTKDILSIVILT